MAYDIGPRLGIDGEAEFRKAINAVNTTIRTLGTEMAAVTSAYDKNDKSAAALSSRSEVLAKQADAQREKLERLKEGLAASAEKYGENDEKTQRWQQAVNRATAELNGLERELAGSRQALEQMAAEQERAQDATGQLTAKISQQEGELKELQRQYSNAVLEYGKNSDEARELAGRINDLSGELEENRERLRDASDSTEDLGDALDDAGDQAGGLKGKLSALGSGLASAAKAAAAVTAAVGTAAAAGVKLLLDLEASTEEYRAAQGRLNTAFEAAGYSTDTAKEAYQALYSVLGDTDNATESAQLLAQLADSEKDMATWADIAAGVTGTFGDALPINSLIEAANETAKVGQITGALADALNWVGISEDEFNEKLAACADEAERTALITDTLSGTYQNAADIFKENSAALIAANQAQADLDDTLARIGGTVAEVESELVAEFIPAIAEAADAFVGLMEGADGAEETLVAAIDTLIEKAAEKLPELLDFGAQIILNVLGGLAGAAPQLTAGAVSVLATLVAGLVEALPQMMEAGAQIIAGLAQGIAESVPELIPAVVDTVLQIVDTLTDPDNLEDVVNAALEIIVALAEGLVEAIPEIVECVPQIIKNLVTALVAESPQITAAALELIVALGSGLVVAIPQLLTQIPQIIAAIVGGLAEGAADVAEAGGQIVEGLWEGITSMGDWIKEKVSGFFGGIVDTVKDLLGIHSPSTAFAGIGENIVGGVWQGIEGMASWIRDKVQGFFGGIVDSVKGLLGISSPSRVFREEVGQYIALGVAEGIADKSDKAVKAADKLAKDVYSRSKDWADKQTKYMDLSYDEQIELWETIQSQFVSASKQWSDAQEVIYDLRQKKLEAAAKAEKGIMSALTDWVGDMEHQLFLTGKNGLETAEETVAAYRAMQERIHETAEEYRRLGYDETSDEIEKLQTMWWGYEDSITELQSQALAEREKDQERFVSNVEAIQKSMDALQSGYLDQLEKRTREIYSAYGLFDRPAERQEVSGQELIDSLAGQVDSVRDFYRDLDALSARGVGDALVEEIRAMGVGAADELEALLNMTGAQLSQYTALYGEKQRQANEIAARELSELRDQTERQLMESLNEMGALFNDQGPEMGRAFTAGIMQGIQSGVSGVESAAVSMANAAVEAVKRELGIASPSKVFARLGGFMAEGLGGGFEADLGAVQRRIDRSMADLASNSSATVRMEAAAAPANSSGGFERVSVRDMAEAMRLAMQDLRVDMDHREVGRIITAWQGNEARSMGM